MLRDTPFASAADYMPKIFPQIKVLDPGRIILGRETGRLPTACLLDQRKSLDLKRETNFTELALSSLYRVAPLSTWGIFTDSRDKKLAQKMLEVFGKQMVTIEAGEAKTSAPQVFVVPH